MESVAPTLKVVIGMPFGEMLGGAERLLGTFLERAGRVGVEPHVVFFADGPWPEHARAQGIPVSVVDPGRFRHARQNIAAAAELRRLLRRERPDVTFGWISRAQVTLAPAALAGGLGGTLAWYQHTVPAGEFIERAARALPARLVLTCSQAGADAQQRLRPRRTAQVARPGIDVPEPLPAEQIEALRTELGIPAGRAVVGISGRLVRWKGQDELLRAVARLAADGRDVHALVVGGTGHGLDVDFEPELRALAAELGIAERVTFTGHVEDALPHTQLMDVSVNASGEEPFGLVLLEAMTLGTPVVAVASGGPLEIVAEGAGGLLVAQPRPDLLAGAIAELLEDPARAAALAAAGRERVLERFTTARWLADVRAGFDRVVAGRG